MSSGVGKDSSVAREEATLEWQLLEAQSQLLSMLQPPIAASAVLHPLYLPSLSIATRPTRSSFQRLVSQCRSSVRAFADEASALSLRLDNEEAVRRGGVATVAAASASSRQSSDSRERKQRVISLLRENSTHSAAITAAAHQLQRTASRTMQTTFRHLPLPFLNACALVTHPQAAWPTLSLEEATRGVERVVQACESLAKELAMEAFAEGLHNKNSEDDTRHTHTLTLAASILVIDVETGLERDERGYWKPVVRLRLSYATDSATSQPRVRDHRLADFIKMDLQAIAELLLGWGHDSNGPQDCISRASGHYQRVKLTLGALKQLDDLSGGLESPKGEALIPDLFAAMEDVCEKLQSSTPNMEDPLVSQVGTGAGLLLQYVGWPYACLVYQASPCWPLTDKASVAEQINKQTLALDNRETPLHCLAIAIAATAARRSHQKGSTLATLPRLDESKAEGALHYTAILHPPVMMPREVARKLGITAGMVGEEPFAAVHTERHVFDVDQCEAPYYEAALASIERRKSSGRMQFAPVYKSDAETKAQGVLVSRFDFVSLEELNGAVVILRQQVQLNDLLCDVSVDQNNARDGEASLESILGNGGSGQDSSRMNHVTLAGDAKVLVNVALGAGCWTLEVVITLEQDGWELRATAFKLGQSEGFLSLPRHADVHREATALLREMGGRGLADVLERLRGWALEAVEFGGQVRKEDDEQGSSNVVVSSSEPTSGRLGRTRKDTPQTGEIGEKITTRRRNSGLPMAEDKEASRSGNSKRRASQAGMDDDEGTRRTSRRRS